MARPTAGVPVTDGGGIDPRFLLASGTVVAPVRGFKLVNRLDATEDQGARHERCGMDHASTWLGQALYEYAVVGPTSRFQFKTNENT